MKRYKVTTFSLDEILEAWRAKNPHCEVYDGPDVRTWADDSRSIRIEYDDGCGNEVEEDLWEPDIAELLGTNPGVLREQEFQVWEGAE